MEFEKIMENVEIVFIKRYETSSMYELRYFGGNLRFYGEYPESLVGKKAKIKVTARIYGPGKVACSVEEING